jgi:hypothetical protein
MTHANEDVARAVEHALRERFATSTPTTDAEWRADAQAIANAAIKAHRQPEPYVDVPTLAKLLGVAPVTIARMVRAGMPSETWGVRTRRFRPSEAIAWARDREASRARGGRPVG